MPRSCLAFLWLGATAAACGGRTLLDDGALDDDDGSSRAGASSTGFGARGPTTSAGTSNGPAVATGGTTGGGDNDAVNPPAGSGSGAATNGGATSPGGFPITPSSDVNCTPANAKGGMACTVPCATTCGFYDMGTKACDCVSGVYVSCKCPRPWNYQGRTTAPRCSTPDGRTHWLDNTACDEEWAQCIGTDPVSGVNPRGCVCLTDPVNAKLEWTCGSTNRWFLGE